MQTTKIMVEDRLAGGIMEITPPQKFGITSLLWCVSSREIWNEHCTESMRYIIFRSFDTQCISVLFCYKNLGLRNVCKSRHIKSLWWNIFLSNSTRQYIYKTQCWVIFDVASCYLSGFIKKISICDISQLCLTWDLFRRTVLLNPSGAETKLTSDR